MNRFYPEGRLYLLAENQKILRSPELLYQAYRNRTIIEAQALMCDAAHNIIVDIPNAYGIIPREKGAVGIAEGTTRDIAILSKVNKPVCFIIEGIGEEDGRTVYTLSRVAAQKMCIDEYISLLRKGDVIPARVTHLEPFGAFVDIGCGIPSLIPIDAISVSRISHPDDRFYNGQNIFAVVKEFRDGKVCLSHKELLGTWEENCADFEIGATVSGIVRSVEPYGVFIEIAPNLAGLAEARSDLSPGQCVSVNIKAMKPDKMKLKLAVVDISYDDTVTIPPKYFIKSGRIDRWQYSPDGCSKTVVSDFSE
ncbi:MAG: S1 RNA-binding domain-containing protein [Oscillospiraceae bacterium]